MSTNPEVKVGQVWEMPSGRKVTVIAVDMMHAKLQSADGHTESAFIILMRGIAGERFSQWKLIKDVEL